VGFAGWAEEENRRRLKLKIPSEADSARRRRTVLSERFLATKSYPAIVK
jgi:hypothetical protein